MSLCNEARSILIESEPGRWVNQPGRVEDPLWIKCTFDALHDLQTNGVGAKRQFGLFQLPNAVFGGNGALPFGNQVIDDLVDGFLVLLEKFRVTL